MASQLHSKINSYAIETGIEFDEPYQLVPTQTGTVTETNATYWTLVGNAPTYESNIGPAGGSGSWRFTSTSASSRLRNTGGSIVSRINDNNYSVGVWFKVGNINLPNNISQIFYAHLPTSTLGFAVSLVYDQPNNRYTLGYINDTVGISIKDNLDIDSWHYFAARRTGNNWELYVDGSLVYTETQSSSTVSSSGINFGSLTAGTGYTLNVNLSNFYIGTYSSVDATAISQIWNVGNQIPFSSNYSAELLSASAETVMPSINPSVQITYSAQPMLASLESVMPSNISTTYSPETPNGFLADTILSYVPEHYYKFNEQFSGGVSKPPIVNYGSVAVADGTIGGYFNALPTLNSTGGTKNKGSWVFNFASGASCPRITFSSPSNVINDKNWSAGLFFKTNFTTPAITHDTAGYQLWLVGPSPRTITVSFVGGTSSDTSKGKLRFTISGGTTFTTTARYDDQSWHYIAIRSILTGSTITYEIYLDGTLFTTTTVADTTTTGGAFQFGDSTISASINGTGNNTYELADAYISPYTSIAQPQINQIWYALNNAPSLPPVNRTHQAEPMIVSDSTLLHPVITVVKGDHVESTTSFEINAIFPSPSYSTGDNVVINVEIFENVNVALGDNISVETGADAVIPSTEMTATALIIDPIVSREPMRANAQLVMPVIYVAPNYFSLVKNLNPVYYISDGQAAPKNDGSWTVTNYEVAYMDDNVTSGEEMTTVGNGKSWRANSNGIVLNQPQLKGVVSNYSDLINNLYATKTLSIEFWYWSIGRPRLPGLNYVESGGLFSDGITVIGEVYDWFSCGPAEASNKMVLISNLIDASYGVNDDPVSVTYRTYYDANPEFDDWNHVVITYEAGANANEWRQKVYLNGAIISNQLLFNSNQFGEFNMSFSNTTSPNLTGPSVGTIFGLTGSQVIKLNDNVKMDEVAIYPTTLSSTQVYEHYSFIKSLSPNENYFSPVIDINANMGNHQVLVQVNFVYEQTPITANALIVQPTIIAGKSINYNSEIMDANAESVNPSLSLGVNIFADPIIVYSEMAAAFHLSSTYYDYVHTNIAPYRYVTFDSPDAYLDFGSDNDYSVSPVVIGGTVVNPGLGINGKSVKTAGTNYTTDGVILKESEWNDDWGTGNNDYVSSFWIQRAPDDTSTGLRIIWNINSYKDNQHVVVYHYQNKLHFQINNQSGTYHTVTSANNVDIFDYKRHHIVIYSHFNNNHNYISIYVDGISIIGAHDIGNYKIVTVNAASADSGANAEINNHPRLAVGCLITPFAQTALPVVPTNTKLILDEIFWDKDAITLNQVTALYNMMPGKTDSVQAPLPFEVSALLVMPTISTDVNYVSTATTAIAELLDPTLYVVKNNDFTADFMSADATMPGAARRDNVIIQAEFMLASCSIGGAGTPRVIDAAPCTATIDIINRRGISTGFGIKVNNTAVFNSVSTWVTYVRLQNQDSIIPSGSVR
jgi:hypothetical protein